MKRLMTVCALAEAAILVGGARQKQKATRVKKLRGRKAEKAPGTRPEGRKECPEEIPIMSGNIELNWDFRKCDKNGDNCTRRSINFDTGLTEEGKHGSGELDCWNNGKMDLCKENEVCCRHWPPFVHGSNQDECPTVKPLHVTQTGHWGDLNKHRCISKCYAKKICRSLDIVAYKLQVWTEDGSDYVMEPALDPAC
ncbi:unnamed protein product [Amoebophrya sp. A120]|nr:unnamed protein product [Amoebophrya sp. A120]|eukprot:GSA120T00012753001.1